LDENQNFGRKSKFWTQIKILNKIQISGENPNIGRKSKFWTKIQISGENLNIGNYENLCKIEMFVTNQNFGQESKLSSGINFFFQKSKSWPKIEFLSKIEIFFINRNFVKYFDFFREFKASRLRAMASRERFQSIIRIKLLPSVRFTKNFDNISKISKTSLGDTKFQ